MEMRRISIMGRMTKDDVKKMTLYEQLLNSVFIKDNETWLKGEYGEISLNNLIRDVAYSQKVQVPEDDEELASVMYEFLYHGPTTPEGLIALLYMQTWTHAEMRQKLKEYEDAEEEAMSND